VQRTSEVRRTSKETTMEKLEKKGSVASTLNGDAQLLTFKLYDQEYALPIANVVQVVRIVAITPMPEAPDIVEGVINIRGKVIPVIDTRRRFSLPARPYDLNTQLLIAQSDGYMMALIVDVVSEVLTMPASGIEPPSEIGPQMENLSAVGKLGDRLLLILDLDKILSFEEEKRLEKILAQLGSLLISADGKRLEKVLAQAAPVEGASAD
jgi:purine-binding chemotaxis protein CheW